MPERFALSLKASADAVAPYLDRQRYLSSVASFSQQHTIISLHAGATVLRAPESVVRGRWTPSVSGFAGEELLLNHRRSGRDLGVQLGVARYYAHDAVLSAAHSSLRERSAGAIALPPHRRVKTTLTTVIVQRRSSRDFSGRAASLEELATILWHAQGISGRLPVGSPLDEDAAVPLRNAPSGGGLYPIQLVVLARNVKGLPEAAYEYQPHSHSLLPLTVAGAHIDYEKLNWTEDVDVSKIGFILVYVYSLYVNSGKYGDSGIVFALIEVGAISQNVHLARTALGMIGCDQGGYNKQLLEQLINCDGTSRHVVHFTFIGHGES
jgi:SagB-type dehydrogenase family enzyme